MDYKQLLHAIVTHYYDEAIYINNLSNYMMLPEAIYLRMYI